MIGEWLDFFELQRVYQLLPPAYRDVWLEWEDAEKKLKDDRKLEENKVNFVYVWSNIFQTESLLKQC